MLILIHHEICSNVHSTSLNLSVKEAPYLLPILEVNNKVTHKEASFGLIVWLNPIRCIIT
jgi:hypothetical protein